MLKNPIKKNVVVLGMQYSGSGIVEDFLRLRADACAPLGKTEWAIIPNARGLLWAESAIFSDFFPARASASLDELERSLRHASGPWNTWSPNPGYGMARACSNYLAEVDSFLLGITQFSYPFRYQYSALRGSVPRTTNARRMTEGLAARLQRPMRGKMHRMPITLGEYRLRVKQFLEALVQDGIEYVESSDLRVLPQAGSFWSPTSSLRLFDNAHVIRVRRDPRDQFAELKVKKGMTDVQDFVRWRAAVDRADSASVGETDRIIDLGFERFVVAFDQEAAELCAALEISSDVESEFNVKPSKKNVGKYKQLLSRAEIDIIQTALPELVVDH